jgi:hypothetical protein
MRRPGLIVALVYVISLMSTILPFLPGSFDPLAGPLAMAAQLYSGLGLFTTLHALLWFYYTIRDRTSANTKRWGRVFFWTNSVVWTLIALFILVGTSTALAIAVFCLVVISTWFGLPKVVPASPTSVALSAALLAPTLLTFQLLITDPITNWSRAKSIEACAQIIEDIERHKSQYGKYPLSLNGIWKDYPTAIIGVERYHYTYDESSYNLYFRQPRFLFDHFGTEEFVVYNPYDTHVMLSHASWHVTRAPGGVHQGQGWYASKDAGDPHWKIFFFD